MEDLKSYSPYHELLENRRLECYRRYVDERHASGEPALDMKNFSIADILKPIVAMDRFEVDADRHLRFYSPAVKGGGFREDPNGEYVKVRRPATEDEPEGEIFLHRSQVFVPQECVENLLDLTTKLLAISFQALQSNLAQLDGYLKARESLDFQMGRLLDAYRRIQLPEMGLGDGSEGAPEKRFFSLDRDTVELLLQRGFFSPDREVLTGPATIRPFLAVWHELHGFHRQAHYQWFLPTVDRTTGRFSLEKLDLLDGGYGEVDHCGGQYLDDKRSQVRIPVEEVARKIAEYNGRGTQSMVPVNDGSDWLQFLNQGVTTLTVPRIDCSHAPFQAGHNVFLLGSRVVRDEAGREFYEFVGDTASQHGDHLDAQVSTAHRPVDPQLELKPEDFMERMTVGEALARDVTYCYFPQSFGNVLRQSVRSEADRIASLNHVYGQQSNADQQELNQIFQLSSAMLSNLDKAMHQSLRNLRS